MTLLKSLLRPLISRLAPKREPPKPPTLKERLDAVKIKKLEETAASEAA